MLVREPARGRGLAEWSRGLMRCEDSSALLALPRARMPVGGLPPPRSASVLQCMAQLNSDALRLQLHNTYSSLTWLRPPQDRAQTSNSCRALRVRGDQEQGQQ